jgi:hypothetical protein
MLFKDKQDCNQGSTKPLLLPEFMKNSGNILGQLPAGGLTGPGLGMDQSTSGKSSSGKRKQSINTSSLIKTPDFCFTSSLHIAVTDSQYEDCTALNELVTQLQEEEVRSPIQGQ